MKTAGYDWQAGAKLLPHSAKKLSVLRAYFAEYLRVRCQNPQVGFFRLAVVDGFCGAGRYRDGESGSPLVFVEELRDATISINMRRQTENLKPLEIECDLILNDSSIEAYRLVSAHLKAAVAEARDLAPHLKLRVRTLNSEFSKAYPDVKRLLHAARYQNVVFNLDPYGNSDVDRSVVEDIMTSFDRAEVFLTMMIESLIKFLNRGDRAALERSLRPFNISPGEIDQLDGTLLSKNEWLGAAERIVFEAFKKTAPYVSPFSIQNPEGWRYWLLHFSNAPKARQVYNDILHEQGGSQAHFGRSGLRMLTFSPEESASLYLFDEQGRKSAYESLLEDIPRYISEHGDAISVSDFFAGIYNMTPAHSKDINRAVFDNPEVEVLTTSGSHRRRAQRISPEDTLRLRKQMSFPSLWLHAKR